MTKTLVILLAVLLTGCATIQHPSTPNLQYASMEQCMIANRNENPEWCGKVMHAAATNQAVQTTAVTVGVMAHIALIILTILSFR